MKIDWLRLECRIRTALRSHVKDIELGVGERDSAVATLWLISEILGDETGRGYELDREVEL